MEDLIAAGMAFARDSSWQFFGILISAAVAVSLYMWGRPRKSLGYEVVSHQRLLTQKEQEENRLVLTFSDERVPDASIVVLTLTNSGKVAIVAEDFERALSIDIGSEGRILTADVIEKDPDALDPKVTWDGSELTVMPLLLNRKDSVTIKLLVSNYKKVAVSARIAGVKTVKNLASRASFVVTSMIGLALFITGLSLIPNPDVELSSRTISAFGAIVVGYVFMLYGLFRSRGSAFKVMMKALADHFRR